jgi:hypothetical protein
LFKAGYADSRVEIYIRHGFIVYAESFKGSYRLGDVLHRRGLLSADQISATEEQVAASAKTFGRVLLESGLQNEEQLRESITELTQDIFLDLFRQADGDFEYDDADIDTERLVLIRIHIRKIIFDTIRKLDELKVFQERLPNENIAFAMREKASQSTSYQIGAATWKNLSLVYGRHTIQSIVRQSGYNIYEVYRTVIALMDARIIEPLSQNTIVVPVEEDTSITDPLPKDGPSTSKSFFGLLKKKS